MRKLFSAFHVLSEKSRKGFLWVLIVSTMGMGLEVLGVGMVMPLIDLLVSPETAADSLVWQTLLSVLGEDSNVLLLGLICLVGLFAFKNLFLAYQVNLQSKYSFGVQVETSTYLFENYLGRPYEFFLGTNTSELLRNAIGEVNSFVGYVLQPLLIIIAESLVLLAIVVLLLCVEPLASLMAIAFVGALGWAFHRFTRRRVNDWGKERQHREGLKIKCLQEGFNGIKVIKLLEEHSFLGESFREHTQLGAAAGRKQYAMQQMPRLLLETLAILGLAILAIGLVSVGEDQDDALPKLGMIAFGLVRVMPSVARIVHSSQSIVYGWPCVKVLREELGDWDSSKTESEKDLDCSFSSSFSMKEVSFAYSQGAVNSLVGVSIEVPKGSSVGIIGESGSGKSTLVDIALGLLEPCEGALFVDGRKLENQGDKSSWRKMIGYVPQEIYLTDDTLRNNVAFGVDPCQIDEEKVLTSLKEASLLEFVQGLPDGLDAMMGERGARLSGGQRQRVGIARALYHDPAFIVFDEATSSLDSDTEKSVMETVLDLQRNKTFLIVAHRLSTLKNCDRIYRVHQGRIVESGSFSEISEN
ncbi:MAG TPA: ATPase [Opitutae bacterium]|nr:ATPase [Opitutae bacterium]|tara:strand:- start:5775 stop:7523 length:1749 start_codon:yes stop_codon:yes gene_type:complete